MFSSVSFAKFLEQQTFNPIQDGLFQECLQVVPEGDRGRGGGGKRGLSSLKSVAHILRRWNLAQLYLTLRRPKKDMNHVTYHLGSAGSRIFSLEISKFYTANKILSRDSIYIADVVM